MACARRAGVFLVLAGWLAGLAACRTVAEAAPAGASPAPRAAAAAPSAGAAPDTVKLAVLAHVPVKWDKEANLAALDRMARGAAAAGAELLVTPEGALEGYLIDELLTSPEREKWEPRFQEIAEPVDGPGVGRVRALARELGVDIVLGFLERDGALLHNSCAWIDRNGEVLHVHRKTHEAQPVFDPPNYHPGHEARAFDTRFGRAGMLICYERQIPEVARALALDGARLLVNPSYGSRGEWNTVMLRARARDNEAALVFAHPKQALIIAADGKVVADVDNEAGAGVVRAELPGRPKPPDKLLRRRPEVFAEKLGELVPGGNQRQSRPGRLRVAVVQMHSGHDLKENTAAICRHLAECAQKGARVAVFPECATTGYFREDIPRYSQEELAAAAAAIAAACAENRIFAVVGTPWHEDGQRHNMALVMDDQGRTVFRQPKIHLVGGDKPWAVPGGRMGLFRVDGHLCSALICHDSRYPELVRLPVLRGARLIFYLSCESGIQAERKMAPYRAQVSARAVENNVWIAQANTPQRLDPLEGSHGQSRIVAPDGNLLCEASIFDGEVLLEELDLSRATGETARKSLDGPLPRSWWEEALARVSVPE